MFGTIRKHQTWLWVFVISVTIIGMVSFFSPTSQFNRQGGAGEGNYGVIDDVPVTQIEYDNARREAYLRFVLSQRLDSKATFEDQSETYPRLFVIRKLKQFNIEVDDVSVAQAAAEVLRRHGATLDKLLLAIAQQGRGNVPIRDTDFERYIRHELGIEQLALVTGLSGDLVTPKEVQSLYVHLYQDLATEAVFFPGSNYLAGVAAPAPAVLAGFYTKHMSAYRLPVRVQVSYVRFDFSNYLAQVQSIYTNVAQDVEANFAKLGTNVVHYGKTPEEAKKKIGEELLRQHTMYDAYTEANRLLNQLFLQDQPQPEQLAALAATNKLVLKVTQPFDEVNGPAELDGGPNFAPAAFLLTAAEPVAGRVIMGENAAFIVALDKRLPSEVPPLDTIHDRVLADYRYSQAVAQAQQAGEQFFRAATNGIAQGRTFAAICAGAKVKPVTVPPFSLNAQPRIEEDINAYEYKQNAFTTRVGQAGYFSPPDFGSVVVYVEKRLPIDEVKMKTELPLFLTRVRQERRQELFNAWLQREANKSLRDIMRPPTPRTAPPAPGPGKS